VVGGRERSWAMRRESSERLSVALSTSLTVRARFKGCEECSGVVESELES